jgi:hypothetical protein
MKVRSISLVTLAASVCLGLPSMSGAAAGRHVAKAAPEAPEPAAERATAEAFDALPMAFEPNVGQTDARVRYVARGRGYGVFLTHDEVGLSVGGRSAVRMRLDGARAGARVEPAAELPGRVNYLVGSDPAKWHADVPTYAGVRVSGVYEGIDAVFYGSHQCLEYDFEVAPGADPSQIRIRFEGAESVEVEESGDVVLKVAGGELRQQRAAVYQEGESGRRRVASRYVVAGDGGVGLELGDYDPTRPLVVDPTLVFSTLVGGSDGMSQTRDGGRGVAMGQDGAIYVLGYSTSNALPAGFPMGGVRGDLGGTFVLKLDPTGTSVLYATWFAGDVSETPRAIAVDATGAAYVTGTTGSTTLPGTNGFDRTPNGGGDGFVFKLDPTGSNVVYATVLGGSDADTPRGIAVDGQGSAYVTGQTRSASFPVANAYDATFNGPAFSYDAFVTKLAPDGGSLAYSTFLGGAADENAYTIAVDAAGRAFVGGGTGSSTFPTANAYDATPNGFDAFVTEFAPDGGSLAYSTFLGGSSGESVTALAVDAAGAIYVAGSTASTDFPLVNAADATLSSGEAFVAEIAPAGTSLVYSTYFGGIQNDTVGGIAVDSSGAAYVTGATFSNNIPVTNAFDATYNERHGEGDAFALKVNPTGSFGYATYLGGEWYDEGFGVAVGADGQAVVVGETISANFPSTASAFDPTYNGGVDYDPGDRGGDVFVTKLTAAGTALTFSTYIGGGSEDRGDAIAVDASGAIYLAGETLSANLAGAGNAFGGGYKDAYVAKLDPTGTSLVFTTYLGGSESDGGIGLAVDAAGAVYLAGYTGSADFPTANAYDATLDGSGDAFVTKLAPDGGSFVYSTFFGGGGGSATAIAVDSSGAAIVVGTAAANLPLVNAVDTTYTYKESFVTKFAPSGTSLVYSTYLGGTDRDEANAVAVDQSGAAYVVGFTTSADFPVTASYDVTNDNGDMFVTKLTASGAFAYSTFLGGSGGEFATAVAVDATGSAYVAGYTSSANYPTRNAFDATHHTGGYYSDDAVVTKLNAAGTDLVYSTYLGGAEDDYAWGVAVDVSGAAYVVGQTAASSFPRAGPVDATRSDLEGFVTKLAPQGNALLFSTFLGGGLDDVARAVAVGPGGVAYVAGDTDSLDFPTPGGPGQAAGRDAFVAKFRTTNQTLGSDTPGVVVASTGAWFLKDANAGGPADTIFTYGGGGSLVPLAGDWNGDGTDTPGLYNPVTGAFFLKNSNAPGGADTVFTFGAAGAGLVALSGDWDGDGADSVGLYAPSTGAFFLKNANAPGPADAVFSFGPGGAGLSPMAGDWNGDGVDTVGLYVSGTGTFFLRNANASGPADLAFSYGPANVTPLRGDWNGDGVDTVGVYVAGTGAWFLRNANGPGAANLTFSYGPTGVVPLAGNWDGQ